ncbi:MAG TPA: response regulator, partial [Ruminococcus sp.]|nr:response regulator [Ruminococcus sp.]
MKKILLIEDEAALREELSVLLKNAGYTPVSVTEWDSVPEQMKSSGADLILLDINLPGLNGEALLQEFRRESSTPVIMLTAYGSINQAVEAMRLGAVDYLVKPVNLEELELVIQRALEGTRLRRTGDALKAARKGLTDNPMVGASPAMRQVWDLIEA